MTEEKNMNSIVVSGKRKTAVAKATINQGTGKIYINKIPYENLDFFKKLTIQEIIELTKKAVENFDFDIDVRVSGGGNEGQISAARVAIARALVEITKSEKLKKTFLDYDRSLLVADIRRKEAYKPGDSKARRKRQASFR